MTSLAVTALPSLELADRPPGRSGSALAGLKITFGGLLYSAILVLVCLAAMSGETNLLFLLFGINVGVLIFSAAAPVWIVRKIDADRIVPEAVVAGGLFKLVYIIRNRRKYLRVWSIGVGEKPAGRRTVRFPQAFLPVLGPRCEQRVELTARCPQRGRVMLAGIRVTSRFPFGLFSCSVDIAAPAELIVYPMVGRFRRDPWRDRRLSGSSAATQVSQQTSHDEFYGVREYREGDNLRWVHWRRSARTGELVVREMMPLRPTQLIVLVDPWPEPLRIANRGLRIEGDQIDQPVQSAIRNPKSAIHIPRAGHTADQRPDSMVEKVISAAATALCDGLERGYRVGIICRAAVPIVIPPANGRTHRQRLLNELALIAPPAPESLDELVGRIRWSSGWHARCMLCTTHPNESHSRVLRFISGRAEAVMLLSPQSDVFDTLLAPVPSEDLVATGGF